MQLNRRRLLQSLAALGVTAGSPRLMAQVQPRPVFAAYPFSLGVASGYPLPQAVMIWTRLAPLPDAPGGGMNPEIVPVTWEVGADERMSRIVASGTSYANPAWGHSLHVLVPGLQPARSYWYRFTAGDAQSPLGRTHTAPAANAKNDKLRFAFASCQQYEQGYYGAYRHMREDDPDLVLFLGDYIYEGSWGANRVRRHNGPEVVTLDDYRARYALYKSDPDLQAMHAACPWVLTWDDHEVENDYAGAQSENLDNPEWFLARRAAAYKAYYENQPLPVWATPYGAYMRIHNTVSYGSLARFHVLDDRQYRSPQACPPPARGGSNRIDAAGCAALTDTTRTLLGEQQERWLDAGLSSTRARWNVLAQQTLLAQWDQKEGPGVEVSTDGWSGYPAARQRLIDQLISRKPANPVVIGGDVHQFFVTDIKQDFADAKSPTVASEFVGTSITSQAGSQPANLRRLADNPHVRLVDSSKRGYVRAELTPTQLRVDLRAMDSVTSRDAPCSTLATFIVEDGRPGAKKA